MKIGVFADQKSEFIVSGKDIRATIARPVKPEYALARGFSEVSILASGQLTAAPIEFRGSTAIIVSTRGLLDSVPQASSALPTFSPVSGTSVPAGSNLTVTITPGTVGATLHYTMDGSDVTAVSNMSIRTATAAVSVVVPSGQAASYQARNLVGGSFSAVAFANYEPAGQLATPIFTPSSGPSLPVSVSVFDPVDSDVWYTTDPGVIPSAQGSLPGLFWTRYSAPISVSATTMLRAQGRDHSTKSNSQVATAVYGLEAGKVSLGFVTRTADRVGVWGVFTKTGTPTNLQFNFFANFSAPVTIHVLMFVNKAAQATQLWSTWRRPVDLNLVSVTGGSTSPNGAIEVYPTVVDFAGQQLLFNYVTPAANLMLDNQPWPFGPNANLPNTDPVGNLGNYSALVAFSCFASGVALHPVSTMKVVLYASPIGSNVVTRYWAECLVP